MKSAGTREYHPLNYVQRDPGLGWKLIPHAEGVWTKPEREFFAHQRINRMGFHDQERDVENGKPDGTFRILVLGDSMVEAIQVPQEDTFPTVLEKGLNLRARDIPCDNVQVFNLGVTSYGTDQEWILLQEVGLALEPDMVILAFLAQNDVRNNCPALERRYKRARVNYKPHFELTESGVRLVQFDLEAAERDMERKRKETRTAQAPSHPATDFLGRVSSRLRAHSALWELVERRGRHGRESEAASSRDILVTYQVFLDQYPPEWEEAWRVTRAIIRQMAQECRRRSIQFVLLSLPTQEQTRAGYWRSLLRRHRAMRAYRWDTRKPERILTSIARENGIPFISLADAATEYQARSGRSLYFPTDGHFSAEGHSFIASRLLPALMDVMDRYCPGSGREPGAARD